MSDFSASSTDEAAFAPPTAPAVPNTTSESLVAREKSHSRSAYSITKEQWFELFMQIKMENNIAKVARSNNIRIQTLTKKYNIWKSLGIVEDFHGKKGKWNRYFADEEENVIVYILIWTYLQGLVLDPTSLESIRGASLRAYKHHHNMKAGREFKASIGWINQFIARHPEVSSLKSGKYFRWSLVSKSQ